MWIPSQIGLEIGDFKDTTAAAFSKYAGISFSNDFTFPESVTLCRQDPPGNNGKHNMQSTLKPRTSGRNPSSPTSRQHLDLRQLK